MVRKIEAKAADAKVGLTTRELVGFLASLPVDPDSGIELRVVAGWHGQIKSIAGTYAEAAPAPELDLDGRG